MVQLSCGVQCSRAALFALNIVFLLIGFTVMGFGIYIKVNGNFKSMAELYSISEALGSNTMNWVGISMIVMGLLTSCLAAFGCLGAVLNNRCLLYFYTIILIVIILMEAAGVIVTLVHRNKLWNTYDSGFLEVFNHAYSQNQTETIKIIENLEREFQCCGVNGPRDYLPYRPTYSQYPPSCYKSYPNLLNYEGCAVAVVNWVWKEIPIIAGVLGGILFIEIFGVISSLVLGVAISHSLRADYDYRKF